MVSVVYRSGNNLFLDALPKSRVWEAVLVDGDLLNPETWTIEVSDRQRLSVKVWAKLGEIRLYNSVILDPHGKDYVAVAILLNNVFTFRIPCWYDMPHKENDQCELISHNKVLMRLGRD